MTFVSILSQIKLLFGLLFIQLVWYILKQLFTSVSVGESGGYLPRLGSSVNIHLYSLPLWWIIVNYSSPLNFHVARQCSSAEDHYQPLQFTTKFSPIVIGLNCSRGAIVFIRGGPLSAHSARLLKIPGWIVAVREIFL